MEICEYFKIECYKGIFCLLYQYYRQIFIQISGIDFYLRIRPRIYAMLNSYLKINERGQRAKGLHDLCFQGKTDFGYCAAKDMHYYGLKIGLRISRLGMIIHYCLFPTHSHDVKILETILEEFEGIAIA